MSRTREPKSGAVSREYHLAVVERWEERVRKLGAEVATLRGHVKLLAEWQAARRERKESGAIALSSATERLAGEALRSVWNRYLEAIAAVTAVESRMLAAELPGEKGGAR